MSLGMLSRGIWAGCWSHILQIAVLLVEPTYSQSTGPGLPPSARSLDLRVGFHSYLGTERRVTLRVLPRDAPYDRQCCCPVD